MDWQNESPTEKQIVRFKELVTQIYMPWDRPPIPATKGEIGAMIGELKKKVAALHNKVNPS